MSPREMIRVLVIDDSAYTRQAITRMLESSPLVEVVAVARDGEEALRKTFDLKPDLITLDLQMPRMDGFTFLRVVMHKCPTPVMVISGQAGEEDVFRALELGAVDFIAKPTLRVTPEVSNIEQELIRKVHAIRELRIDKVQERIEAPAKILPRESIASSRSSRVVVIGSSTGGPAAIMQIMASFSEPPSCAFLIAQHMPAGFTRGFAERLDRMTRLSAREAEGGEELKPGTILLAPGGKHLELETIGGKIVSRIIEASEQDKYVPSVDKLFESAAKHIGAGLLSIVLTGMGDDGRQGVQAVKLSGGRIVAESESTAVIFGMPQQAIRSGVVDEVLPLGEIAQAIQTGLRYRSKVEKNQEGRHE